MSSITNQPILFYVDHTSRFAHNTGIQRCVRAMAKALLDAGQPLIPVIWNRTRSRLAMASPEALEHLAKWNGPASDQWSHWSSSDPAPDWLLITELVRGPSNPTRQDLIEACRPIQIRDAWLFHDAIPLKQPLLYGSAAQEHGTYMIQLGSAEVVFCNSQQSFNELQAFWESQQCSSNTVLRHLPLADRLGQRRSRPPKAKTSAEQFEMLCISTLEPRKNHRGLLKALSWLHSQDLRNWQLTLVGWPASPGIHALIQRCIQVGLPVQWLNSVSDEELVSLYQACDFTVFPSLEEGFGLPVAESLWQQRPCLCSGDGAIGERTRGGGCETVNTQHWPSLAAGLKRLLTDPQRRQQLQHELERKTFRSWSNVASDVLKTLGALSPVAQPNAKP